MTTPIPPFPGEFSTEWEAWILALDLGVRELQALYLGLAPPSGFISSINGTITPDPSGNVTIDATTINAEPSGYQPAVTDMPLTTPDFVYKSLGGTGVWPTGFGTNGAHDYTGGTNNHGTRPHDLDKPVVWVGYPPFPDTVDSGTGGMRRGKDQMAIPEP